MTGSLLERLISKYSHTRYSVAKKMAEIKLYGMEGEYDYKDELKKKTKNYQSSFSRYESEGIKPKIVTLSLISQAIGCNREELESVFHSPDYSLTEDDDNVDQLLKQECEFKCLEVSTTAIYCINNSNSLSWSKRYKIKCLQENLQVLKDLDFYKCIGEPVMVDYSEEFFRLIRDRDNNFVESFISAEFYEPLKEGQEVEFTINYSCNKIHEHDSTFHATWVLHPTDLLRIDYTPPNPRKGKQAKIYEYENRGDYLQGHQRLKLDDLFLDGESLSFKTEIKNPPLGANYEVYWGQ